MMDNKIYYDKLVVYFDDGSNPEFAKNYPLIGELYFTSNSFIDVVNKLNKLGLCKGKRKRAKGKLHLFHNYINKYEYPTKSEIETYIKIVKSNIEKYLDDHNS